MLEKWIQDWTPNNTHCLGLGPITQTKVATVTDFQGALFLLSIGVGMGILLLVAEVSYHQVASLIKRRNTDTKLPTISVPNRVILQQNGQSDYRVDRREVYRRPSLMETVLNNIDV